MITPSLYVISRRSLIICSSLQTKFMTWPALAILRRFLMSRTAPNGIVAVIYRVIFHFHVKQLNIVIRVTGQCILVFGFSGEKLDDKNA